MPTISVIVPVYRVEKYIHRCIDSILAQTFRDFELILVDDGSPDNCGAICDAYAAKDSRIHVIHQENGGLSAARNAGIDWAFVNSDSQWLTFIDSDDWVHERILEILLQGNVECGTLISICRFEVEGTPQSFSSVTYQKYITEELYCRSDLQINRISAWAKLYHKTLWDGVRFPVGKIHEDRFTTHRVLFRTPEVTNVTVPLYYYTINPEGITHSQWNPRRWDDMDALEEQLAFFEEGGFVHAYHRILFTAPFVICAMMDEIVKDKEILRRNRRYERALRKRLRHYLRMNKKSPIFSFKELCFAFEKAYPVGMTLYWYWKAALRKLRLSK